jgi:hypothetical protein
LVADAIDCAFVSSPQLKRGNGVEDVESIRRSQLVEVKAATAALDL